MRSCVTVSLFRSVENYGMQIKTTIQQQHALIHSMEWKKKKRCDQLRKLVGPVQLVVKLVWSPEPSDIHFKISHTPKHDQACIKAPNINIHMCQSRHKKQ